MWFKIYFGVIVIAIMIIMDSGCKLKKELIKDKERPSDTFQGFLPDSIKKWKSFRDSLFRANTLIADKNPFWFTDKVRREEKPKNTYRIAVLGDSWIWGDGIDYKKVWSHKLEDKLCSKYKNIEVLSWGLCGWTTQDEYDFFVQSGYKYNVDLLIIGFVENDPYMGKEPQTDQADWLSNLYTETNLREYLELLRNVASLKQKYGIKLFFVMTPLSADEVRVNWNNKITSLMNDAGITYLDLYSAYKEKFKDIPCGELFINPINGHPGEKLNEFFADEVLKYLKKNKYLTDLIKKQ